MAACPLIIYASTAETGLKGRICGSVESRKASRQSRSCKCRGAIACACLVSSGSSSGYGFAPTCKMRFRNTGVYRKKAQAKNCEGHAVDIETDEEAAKTTPQSGADLEVGSDTDMLLAYANNGSSNSRKDMCQDEFQALKNTEKQYTASLKESSSVGLVEDLMGKIKEAEKSILMLNQSRLQALEELEQAWAEKNALEGQLNVLQIRLLEADAKLKLANQEKVMVNILKEEVEKLQKSGIEKAMADQMIKNLEAGYKILEENFVNLQTKLSDSEAETEHLRAENQSLQEQISSLRSSVADGKVRDEFIGKLEREKTMLENHATELKLKFSQAEGYSSELDRVRTEAMLLQEKAQQLELFAGKRSTDEEAIPILEVQEKVFQLQCTLAQLESENENLRQAQLENEALDKKVRMLEQRLLDSDTEIRSQLEVYQAEVETFQVGLDQLKHKNQVLNDKELVNDLPWEFWSHLLLSIDAWMVEKQITNEDAKVLRDLAWCRDHRIKDACLAVEGGTEQDLMSGLLELVKANKRHGLHIVHIAAEMSPVAKVGGLGDVVTGLGKALQKKSHLVEVVLPKYDCMDYSKISKLRVLDSELSSYFDGQIFKSKIWVGIVEGLPVYFIEPLHPDGLFWRGTIYGSNDDFRRFTFFSRAALELLLRTSKKPDIIHCHDWHTAAVAPLYWDIYFPQGLTSARIAFTCHNFEYQGTEAPGALASCGLSVQQHYRPDRLQDNVRHDRINLLKGGIVFSNVVTTVSPTYSQEVCGPEAGKGLHVTLTAHAQKFHGILNGIDVGVWNPATDALLKHQYSADDLSGKAECKSTLKTQLHLTGAGRDSQKPLVGCITRLVPQKGVHLIRHAIYRTLELGGQFVLLGSSPIPHIQHEFETMAHQFSGHPHVRLILKYDELLSHCIYAALDILIIPSVFEPCGLTQLIAMQYGTIPVARRTGGLNDSVFDVDDETIPMQQRNGFTFSVANEQGLNYALDRALIYYKNKPNWWIELVKKAMQMDFSWKSSADQYEDLYQKAIERARTRA